MFPWFWFWQPQMNFPLSGNVTQDLAPDVHALYFAGIPAKAGDGALERSIAEAASYGRQLGWLTELVLAQAGSDKVSADQGKAAQARLEGLLDQIDHIKTEGARACEADARAALVRLGALDADALRRLLDDYRD